jgi:signal transduction histidine kinase/DNA-binding response OmpR family regulator
LRIFAHLPLLQRMLITFAAVVGLMVILGFIAIGGISRVESLITQFYRHPFMVSTAIRDVRGAARFTHLTVIDIIHNSKLLVEGRGIIDVEDGRLFDSLQIVEERYLGPKIDVMTIKEMARDWRAAREEIFRAIHAGNVSEIEKERMLDLEERHFRAVAQTVSTVLNFAEHKAAEFYKTANSEAENIKVGVLTSIFALVALSALLAWGVSRSISGPINKLTGIMGGLADGKLDTDVPYIDYKGEVGAIARAVDFFKKTATSMADQHWLKQQLSDLYLELQSQPTKEAFSQVLMSRLVPLMGGGLGAVYLHGNDRFSLVAGYGFRHASGTPPSFLDGESLVGQSARDRKTIVMTGVPADYPKIFSGVGAATPFCIVVSPAIARRMVHAVIEVASFKPFTDIQLALFEQMMPIVGANLDVYFRIEETQTLLEKSQLQAVELQTTGEELLTQSEEVNAANEELRHRSEELEHLNQELRVSEEEMREQREELQAVNEELSLKTAALEERQLQLERARAEADIASRYKSEFLANMSHELRTPLNSLLILAKSLSDNNEKNLNEDQVESAQIIHESGSHLLQLINDILDLAKVEAGKMDIRPNKIGVGDLTANIERRFKRLCENKQLRLSVRKEIEAPEFVFSDQGKIDQIVNNLVSNAIKFTDKGGVTIIVRPPSAGELATHDNPALVVEVEDTGIGIPENKLHRLFRSFEQLDSASDRRHAGTGLGLAISLKLARLLGGDIDVSSTDGVGSCFTLFLPSVAPNIAAPPEFAVHAAPSTKRERQSELNDDREDISSEDKSLLVVEDDLVFARLLLSTAKRNGFKVLHAADGASAIDLAKHFRPVGIVLDLGLPDISGTEVMERLQNDHITKRIPVHVVSGRDGDLQSQALGAAAFFTKPVTTEQIESAIIRFAEPKSKSRKKRVLIVDGDPASRKEVEVVISRLGGIAFSTANGAEGLAKFIDDGADCIVTDLTLPDMEGEVFLSRLSALAGEATPPAIIYCSRIPKPDEAMRLQEYTDCVILKGGKSESRLLDEISLFLHLIKDGGKKGKSLAKPEIDTKLRNKKVLVVDDDMRNAFAISKILRNKGLSVLLAQDGQRAIKQIEDNHDIDIVLMDIMMPGMDGYETMRAIRAQEKFAKLPIITVSARAMQADIERSRDAGSNGYVTKPIDMDKLFTEMIACLGLTD